MKFRRVAIFLGLVLAVAVVGLVAVFSPAVQTWAVQWSLRRHPEWHVNIEQVSARWGGVTLKNVKWDQGGYRVSIPAVQATMPVLPALLWHRVNLSALTIHGLQVAPGVGLAPANRPPVAATLSGTFRGFLSSLDLPFELSAEDIDVSGVVVLSSGRGQVQFEFTGGGVAPGRQAKLALNGRAALADHAVRDVAVHGEIRVTMADTRRLARVDAEIDATATTAAKAVSPVRLAATIVLRQTDSAEEYSVVLRGTDRRLLTVLAAYPRSGGSFRGSWTVDMRDSDLVPFALGTSIPAFTAVGHGSIEATPGFSSVHTIGQFEADVDQLGKIKPALAAIGALKVTADLDVARSSGALSVAKFDATISTDHRVASVHATQAFNFDLPSRKLSVRDPSLNLVDVVLDGVPVRWFTPFTGAFEIQGSDIRGELVAMPRTNGISFRSKSPLTIGQFGLKGTKRTWIRNLDLSVNVSADYAEEAWQAEVTDLIGRQNGKPILRLDLKAGQLAGIDQPVKATGSATASVPAALEQLLDTAKPALSGGDAAVDFTTSIGTDRQIQARLSLKNLVSDRANTSGPLPAATADVRADFSPGGKIVVRAPIAIERAGHRSDATLAGTITPSKQGLAIDGQIISGDLVLDDAKAFTSVVQVIRNAVAPAPTGEPPSTRPFWAGWAGTVALQLKRIEYSSALQMTNVVGLVRISDAELKLENVHAAVGDSGNAQGAASVSYTPVGTMGYAAAADVALSDFDVTPLFRDASPLQPPTVEGRFTITTKLTARGAELNSLAFTSESQVTSKGGVFRGIPASVGNLVENSGKLASWIASAGNAITALAGRKDYDEIPNRSQAANEVAGKMAAISYDQLSAIILTDGTGNAEIRNLSLISPEIRLSATGRGSHAPGTSWLEEVVALEYKVRARGREAELMKYLGVLSPKPDDLGYAECTIPVKVEGTLAKFDATEVSNRLVALAVEKTGLTEKAVDWINRLRGKSSN